MVGIHSLDGDIPRMRIAIAALFGFIMKTMLGRYKQERNSTKFIYVEVDQLT